MLPLLRTLIGIAVGGFVALLPHGGRKTGRRSFVRNATLGSVGIVSALTGGGFVALLWPNKTGDFGRDLTVSAAEVPTVGAAPLRWAPGKFYLIRNPDGVLAVYWKCVHLGCTVPFIDADGQFRCPCHGSVYDANGAYVSGPAPRSLDTMPVEVDDEGNVTVATGTIQTRGGYSPEQAVAYNF